MSDSFHDDLLREWNEAGERRRLVPLARLSDRLAADLTALFDRCEEDEHLFRDGLRWFFDSEDDFVEKRGWDEIAFHERLGGAVAAGRKRLRRRPNLSAPVPPETPPPRTAEELEAARREAKQARARVARLGARVSLDQGGSP